MTTSKYVPMRTCIVTRKKMPKNELIRLVRTEGDNVVIDMTGKVKGRGANITMDIGILEKALDKHLVEKALRLNKKLSEEERKKLKEEFANALAEKNFRKTNKPVKIRVTKEKLQKIDN